MESKRLFSVLVPVYNVEKYLDTCINSVLQQTYQNFELILVNDGSKDTSGAICDRYAAEDERIFAYHKENGGQLHTRLYAISKAHGDYCVFLDSDDTLRPNALQTILEKFEGYGCDCVVYQYERVREDQVVQPAARFDDLHITDKAALYKRCFLSTAYNSMCRKAVKMELLRNSVDYSRFYHLRTAEDLLQSIDVIKKCNSVVFIDDVLYNYTYNPTSVSHTTNYENYKLDYSIREYLASFLQEEKVWSEDDFAEYRAYCASLFCGEILAICRSQIAKKKKKELLQKMRETRYFETFLSQPGGNIQGKRKFVFYLFCHKHDDVLCFLGNLMKS